MVGVVSKNRKVWGVGINDAGYTTQIKSTIGHTDDGRRVQKFVWICPFYQTWRNMLQRGYSQKYKEKWPTYTDVTVCEEWHLFSNFKSWMETQDWEGKYLDKDILMEGNRVYSPDRCVFITQLTNTFFLECGRARGEYCIGVSKHKLTGKFQATCNNPLTKNSEYLGLFTTELEAHSVWLNRKLELAYKLAAGQSDARVAEALINRYKNYKLVGEQNE